MSDGEHARVAACPSHGLFVEGRVRSTNFRLLIDTGSTDTLVSATVYYRIPKEQRPFLEECDIAVRQVDGTPLPVLGAAWVELTIGRTTLSQ